MLKQSKIKEETIKTILKEYKIMNCELIINEEINED